MKIIKTAVYSLSIFVLGMWAVYAMHYEWTENHDTIDNFVKTFGFWIALCGIGLVNLANLRTYVLRVLKKNFPESKSNESKA